jgi:hypothetical protein
MLAVYNIVHLQESQSNEEERSDAVTRKIEQLKLRVNRRLVRVSKWIDTPAHERVQVAPEPYDKPQPMAYVNATRQPIQRRVPPRPTLPPSYGVYREGDHWVASINQMGKQYLIGHFATEHEAKLAHARAQEELRSSGGNIQRDVRPSVSFGGEYVMGGNSMFEMGRQEPGTQGPWYGYGSEGFMEQQHAPQPQQPMASGLQSSGNMMGLDFLNPSVNPQQLQTLLHSLNSTNISALLAMQKQAVHQAQMQFNAHPQDSVAPENTHSSAPLGGMYPYSGGQPHYLGNQPAEMGQHGYHSPSIPQHGQASQPMYGDPQVYGLPQNMSGMGPMPPGEYDPRYQG